MTASVELSGWTAEEIYAAYHDRILGYMMSRVERREDAEDLCGEVFEKLCRALPSYDAQRAALSTWIYAIARNALRDHLRRRRPDAPLPEELEDGGAAPEERLIREESLTRLAAALSGMPQLERDVVVLRYYAGHSLTVIAEMTGRSYGTVKLTHQRALDRLRRILE